MPRAQQKHGTSRQRPVSCQFCRTRKLRCSRTAPCTNCVSRGIACDLEHSFPQPGGALNSSSAENTEIHDRLRRLENLLDQQAGAQGSSRGTSEIEATESQFVRHSALPARNQAITADGDHGVPQSINLDKIPSIVQEGSEVVLKIRAASRTPQAHSYAPARDVDATRKSKVLWCVWLPLQAEAQALVDKFVRVAYHVPRVAHIPTISSVLGQVYSAVDHQNQMQLGKVVLLLSIFAVATHSWHQSDCFSGPFTTSTDANAQSSAWVQAAADVLAVASRSSSISIETVQGAVITAFVAAHVIGIQEYRLLFGTSIVLARRLGLHRIDHPSNASIVHTAQAEIGRRLWWHLCANDWMMAATVRGMEEGVYSCHPRQMTTKKPLNINDEELFDGIRRTERLISQPTIMSYPLQFIHLAEVSRGIIDRHPIAMANLGGLSHDAVMGVDTDLQTLINDVPPFYSMSEVELMGTYNLSRAQAKRFVLEGRFIYLQLYLHRCKLHLPYFACGPETLAYCTSREICVQHARLIIQSELWQQTMDVDTITSFKFTGLLLGVFVACIVLLMDLTANPSSANYQQQKEDIYKSFNIIEEAKKQSETTGKFVDSIVNVLRKWNVPQRPASQGRFAGAGSGQRQQQSKAPCGTEEPFDIASSTGNRQHDQMIFSAGPQYQQGADENTDPFTSAEVPPSEGVADLSSYWHDFTQSFEQGIDVNSFDWDNIFLELDSSFI